MAIEISYACRPRIHFGAAIIFLLLLLACIFALDDQYSTWASKSFDKDNLFLTVFFWIAALVLLILITFMVVPGILYRGAKISFGSNELAIDKISFFTGRTTLPLNEIHGISTSHINKLKVISIATPFDVISIYQKMFDSESEFSAFYNELLKRTRK